MINKIVNELTLNSSFYFSLLKDHIYITLISVTVFDLL